MGKFSGLGINVSTGVKMTILHPVTMEAIKDKDGKEAYLELLSDDSRQALQAVRKLSKKSFAKQRRRNDQKVEEAVDDLIESQVEKIVSCLTGWYIVDFKGNPVDVPFSEDSAREFLSDPELAWVRNQALVFVADAGNFIKASSPN